MRSFGLFSVFLVMVILTAQGCASPARRIDSDSAYPTRAATRTKDRITVSASVLTGSEINDVFGVRFDLVGIQPVWLKIENISAYSYVLFLRSIDPDYFSPFEVAHRSTALTSQPTESLYRLMRDLEIPRFIPPGDTVEGYVYTHLDEGLKSINVSLFGHRKMVSFHLAADVPGLITDFSDFDPSALYDEALPSLNKENLREWLESLPCCTFSSYHVFGDPINLVLVGEMEDIKAALVSQQWDVTAQTNASSLWRIARAFIFGSRYRYAPVSNLYLFGREQDVSFQKARAVIDERNHIRLWLAPVTHEGTPVWVGHISRDAGIKLSGRFWPPTTHVIDPAVDEARFFIEQDLLYSQRVQQIALVAGAVGASFDAPRYNAQGDPYFTDGLRAVFFIGKQLTPMDTIDVLNWSLPCELEAFRDGFYKCGRSKRVNAR